MDRKKVARQFEQYELNKNKNKFEMASSFYLSNTLLNEV